MSYRHIVFDVDGTLVDGGEGNLKALQAVLLEEKGRLYPKEELYFTFGITGRDALEQLDIPAGDLDRVWRKWAGLTCENSAGAPVFDGIMELLNELKKRGLGLGIVTSRLQEEWDRDLPRLPFAPLFDHIIVADMTREHKPHPAPLLKYLEQAGARKEETLYVGDTPGDSSCARGAGVDFALAGWGAYDKTIPAKYLLAQPEELLKLLEK